jgi:predicted amidohydrolase YtcJ
MTNIIRDLMSEIINGDLSMSNMSNKSGREISEGTKADIIITNGRIATLDKRNRFVSSVAIRDGHIITVGDEGDTKENWSSDTRVIDVSGRTVVPGLNDSHVHVVRAGLNYNMELRWDGVPTLAEALQKLRDQAKRTPTKEWVRVVGGWSEFQFDEHRMPTLEEINEAVPDNPAFVLHLYHSAMLNRLGVADVGYNRATPDPPGGVIERDEEGNPTGLLLAKPNANILYSTLAKGPKLSYSDQLNSTRQFLRELNRFGITSVIDAGGGFQNFPEDYTVMGDLAKRGLLTVRIAYNLFTQRPKHELEDFANWVNMTKPGQGDDFYRMNGAGEMLVFSAADFENFPEPRPELANAMENELKDVVELLVRNRWPFRIHATYDESITRFLNVFEEVNDETPFNGIHWFFDHAETISEHNIQRVRNLNGGIAVQNRMAFQCEHFVARYGDEAATQAPPVHKMMDMGVPVGAGTDATRVSSYNPWLSLYWLITGKSVGGAPSFSESGRIERISALRLYSQGSAWFSNEDDRKGTIEVGKFADLAVLSADYFTIPEEVVKQIESVLTLVGGKVVYGSGEFERLAPAPLPVSPPWSPVAVYGGYPHSHCC